VHKTVKTFSNSISEAVRGFILPATNAYHHDINAFNMLKRMFAIVRDEQSDNT